MAVHYYQFEFEVLDNREGLNHEDKALLETALDFTANAYAPYSHFHVAAVAKMANGEIVCATNQENASYPVGICAERVLLGILSSSHPNMQIKTMVVTYHNHGEGKNEGPISPCGLCRQSLLEYEQRMGSPIRILLAGQTGQVLIIKQAKDLLPFAFGANDLRH
jgi:cytidine deaminase